MSTAIDAAGGVYSDLPELDAADWNNYAEQQGWSDGLPTIPPIPELIEELVAMLPTDTMPLPQLPPNRRTPTLASLAANAVMAGCQPQHFPVVVAAVRAVAVDEYNLHGSLATTHPCGPMVMLNGPIRQEIGINCGTNCMGQGTKANAVIGRGLQLSLRNIGGAIPGVTDRATFGSPAKYSFCFGEREEDSPWEPYHVRQGFAAEDSVVTVMAAEPPHNINDHGSTTGEGILTTCAGTMAISGSNQTYVRGPHFVVFCIEHAATLQRDGWNVDDIREWLFSNARIPMDRISAGNHRQFEEHGIKPLKDGYPVSTGPEQIQIAVAGGEGKHSVWIPSFGGTEVSSVPIVRVGM